MKACHISMMLLLPFLIGNEQHCRNDDHVMSYTNSGKYSCLIKSISLKADRTYTIQDKYDLDGKQIVMPERCTLLFKGGSLSNGRIIGNNTFVSAESENVLFENVELSGSFSADTAYSSWFSMQPDCVMGEKMEYVSGTDNADALKNLLLFENVSIVKGVYYTSMPLFLKTNQTVEGNGATVKWTHGNKVMSFLHIGKPKEEGLVSNVKIKDLSIVGGKNDSDLKTEYCHGILIENAKNVELENVKSSYNRGDGFYIGNSQAEGINNYVPENVILKSIVAECNQRLGVGITRCKDLIITDSYLINTNGALPESGIDIEPNVYSLGGKNIAGCCENISIRKCHFYGNRGSGVIISASRNNLEGLNDIVNKISITNCEFAGNGIAVYGGNNIDISESRFLNSQFYMGVSGNVDSTSISGCSFRCSDVNNEKTAIQVAINTDRYIRKNLSFSNLYIDGYGGFGIHVTQFIQSGKPVRLIDGLSIDNCRVINCNNSIFIGSSVKNASYSGNSIINTGYTSKGEEYTTKKASFKNHWVFESRAEEISGVIQ